MTEKGWEITERLLLNPENDWKLTEPPMLFIIRSICGCEVFTPPVCRRLVLLTKQGWVGKDGKTDMPQELLDLFALPDDKFLLGLKKIDLTKGNKLSEQDWVPLIEQLLAAGVLIRAGWKR